MERLFCLEACPLFFGGETPLCLVVDVGRGCRGGVVVVVPFLHPMPMCHRSRQTEFFVDQEVGPEALEAVRQVARKWPGWGQWDGKEASTAGCCVVCEVGCSGGVWPVMGVSMVWCKWS